MMVIYFKRKQFSFWDVVCCNFINVACIVKIVIITFKVTQYYLWILVLPSGMSTANVPSK